MHELGITENIRDIAIQHAAEAGGGHITDLHLVIGDLASVQEDSIRLYWAMVSPGTTAEGARIHVRRIPAELVCLQCGRQFSPAGLARSCTACGSTRLDTVHGHEFYLEAIDIETEQDKRSKAVDGKPALG